MVKKLFGTDGLRGVANKYPLTGDVLYSIARHAGFLFKKEKGHNFVFIGKDTRLSCDMFESAIAAGLMSAGIDVYRLGVIPTPALAYITKKRKALFGVMISASHNPFYDNGIKFIGNDGFKIPDSVEIQIEKNLAENTEYDEVTHKEIGKIYEKYNYIDDYIDHVVNIAGNTDFSSTHILIDCANGATSSVAPVIMERLGINTFVIDNNPSGDNINNECGSTNLKKISRIVKSENYTCGIAFDGDGDRCLMVDEKGELVDGDIMLALSFLDRQKKDKNFNNKMVSTVMANMGLKKLLSENKGFFIETPVGDKYVLEKMIEENAVIGGEQSGHIIFIEHNTTGDGIISAIEMLKILVSADKKFSEIIFESGFKRFPQVLYNVKVRTKNGLWDVPGLKEGVKQFENEFGINGRILIRPSGTEPLVRVMAEAEDLEKADVYLKNITSIIEKELG
ncbi:MAG: phosphoglucosamine mutase [Candidatus Muiribacteriota bacterium]